MLRLGIIGTNWISQQFVEAAVGTKQYTLAAVYSRHDDTAQAFIAKTAPAQAFTDLAAFLTSDLDVVYIASPNSLHASQTVQALNAGKHVIVEKPMVTRPSQLAAIQAALDAHPELMVFEAARHLYDPNFQVITNYLFTHHISGGTLNYMKYSSRYDAYLAGKKPNIFTTKFAGGALMDLGIYLVYAAISWFGKPQRATYLPHLLASGVDGDGVAFLDYSDFAITLRLGKTTNTHADSELYFGRDTLTFESPAELNGLRLHTGDQVQDLSVAHAANPMTEEAAFFAKAITNDERGAFTLKWSLAKQVHTVMGQLREGSGLHFDDDPE